MAEHDQPSRELKLLVDHREDLVNQRTQAQNRLRWHLPGLDPQIDPPAGSLDRMKTLDGLAASPAEQPMSVVARITAELVAEIRALAVRERGLEREIAERVRQAAPQLLELPGCGALTAAKIVGETANGRRFRSEACFAMHAGVAPIPASSGKTGRHRLARGGNRQLNAALHRIAVTQIRLAGLATTTTSAGEPPAIVEARGAARPQAATRPGRLRPPHTIDRRRRACLPAAA